MVGTGVCHSKQQIRSPASGWQVLYFCDTVLSMVTFCTPGFYPLWLSTVRNNKSIKSHNNQSKSRFYQLRLSAIHNNRWLSADLLSATTPLALMRKKDLDLWKATFTIHWKMLCYWKKTINVSFPRHRVCSTPPPPTNQPQQKIHPQIHSPNIFGIFVMPFLGSGPISGVYYLLVRKVKER